MDLKKFFIFSFCQYNVLVCIHGEIRLLGGANVRTGRVEVCNDGVWGTVCDDVWGSTDAQVACRQLGYASTGKFQNLHDCH